MIKSQVMQILFWITIMKNRNINTPKLSICIITFNEEDRLKQTLESIKDIADEIVIVDSYSTDNTLFIASQYNSKIYQEDWQGFAKQKNSAIAKTTGDYILSLDADEEVSTELKNDILLAISGGYNDDYNNYDDYDGYTINRKTKYLNKLLKFSWQPDNKLRLVKRSSNPQWIGDIVHEHLRINSTKIKQLNSYIIHHSYKDIEDHNLKTIKYAKLSAIDYYNRGRSPSILKLLFSPILNFLKMYIIRLGFLDGIQGLIAASSGYIYTFYKYAYLYELAEKNRQKRD